MVIKAINLISWDQIEIDGSEFNESENFSFFINEKLVNTNIVSKHKNKIVLKFDYIGEVLGNKLTLKIGELIYTVSVKEISKRKDFDEFYAYFGDDLGSNYSKKSTSFALWAPLARDVKIKIRNKTYQMTRDEKGVYRALLNGNFDGCLYEYLLVIDDELIVSIDPYGKSSNENASKSAVINFDRVKIDTNSTFLPEFKNNVDAVIYEGHIRDLTTSKYCNIHHKGKFLGLAEENRKTKAGNPFGLDYLKYLGITHLQLLPVLDYGSLDETKEGKYNWGYDPVQYFTLEGSYSLNPRNPYSRIKEFKQLIAKLHKSKIRVNLDVVYNHVYRVNEFSLNKITPNYFFRFENGKLADHSWCGNDFASERAMARKFIVDSVLYLLKEFDVDGFRFDLMGLLDIQTMNEISTKCHEIKENVMLYGEGWNMNATSEFGAEFATMKKAYKLNKIAFFNDRYRNIMRGLGSNSSLEENGFLFGNRAFESGFKFAYYSGTKDVTYKHLFNSYNQTINYVECHDNATIYDVISESSDIEDKLRMVKLFNKVLLLSPGIPFIHMGQEIGLSKKSQANTYNLGDYYNRFNAELIDERFDLVNSLKSYIKIRKNIALFSNPNPKEVNEKITIKYENEIYNIELKDKIIFHFVINIDGNKKEFLDVKYSLWELFIPQSNKTPQESLTLDYVGISPHKCSIYVERKWIK